MEFPAGERRKPPWEHESERGHGGCFISSSLGNVSRLTAQRPRACSATIPHEATDSKDSLDGSSQCDPRNVTEKQSLQRLLSA